MNTSRVSLITNPNHTGAWASQTTTYKFEGAINMLTESNLLNCLARNATTTKSRERVANPITGVRFTSTDYIRREDGAKVLMAGYGQYPDGGVETFHVIAAN